MGHVYAVGAFFSVVILVGCGGGGDPTLVRLAGEPAGANCPSGGVVIYTGADANGDGVLADEEVSSMQFTCNGSAGANGADGTNGSDGASGMDGTDGVNGSDAHELLAETTDEPAGENCPNGGTRIDIGLDLDDNGVLAVGETTETLYVCDAGGGYATVLDGSYTIQNSLDAALLTGVQTITGDLVVLAPGMSSLSLPDLVEVRGTIRFFDPATGQGNPDLASVSMPSLTRVGRDFDVQSSPMITSLDVSALTTVGGSLYLYGAFSNVDSLAALTSVSSLTIYGGESLTDVDGLTGLSTGAGNIHIVGSNISSIAGLANLTSVVSLVLEAGALTNLGALANLTTATFLRLASMPMVMSLDGLSGLTSVSTVVIDQMPALTDISALRPTLDGGTLALNGAPALLDLSGLSGITSFANLSITNCDGLTDLDDLSSVTSLGNLSIQGNDALTRLVLPALTNVTGTSEISIRQNSALTRIELPVLTASAGRIVIATNDVLAWLDMAMFGSMPNNASFGVSQNPLLAVCQATSIVDRLRSNGWTGVSNVNGATCYTIDFCRIQSPLDSTVAAGSDLDASGRLYIGGLTGQTSGVDAYPTVLSSFGVGPDGTDPSIDTSWSWFAAAPQPDWNGSTAGEPNNDEYSVRVTAPAVGVYDVAFRFSGDGGRTWTYCDRNAGPGSDGSQDGYQIVNAPTLTTN